MANLPVVTLRLANHYIKNWGLLVTVSQWLLSFIDCQSIGVRIRCIPNASDGMRENIRYVSNQMS